jgi:hypothetical protein
MRTAVCVAALSLTAAGTSASAQQAEVRRFSVTPTVGAIRWDEASGFATKGASSNGVYDETGLTKTFTPSVGVAANYMIVRQAGIGLFFEAARPETRGDYFPALLLTYGTGNGAPVELRTISQRMTTVMYGVQGQLGLPLGPLTPYAAGGFGAVSVFGDPQQNNRNAQFSKRMATAGGGLAFHVGSGAITLDARDHIFMDWDRNKLNPVDPQYQNNVFPTANGNPPKEKSTVHNFRIALGFSYTPKLGQGSTSDESDDDKDKE